HRSQSETGRNKDFDEFAFTVHQCRQRPVRDTENKYRYDNVDDFHETVQFPWIVIVDDESGILGLQDHRERQRSQDCEGDPKARSLIAFVLQFPIGIKRMNDQIERKSEYFSIQYEQPSFFFAISGIV